MWKESYHQFILRFVDFMYFKVIVIKKCELHNLAFYLYMYLINANRSFYYMYEILNVYGKVPYCMEFFSS